MPQLKKIFLLCAVLALIAACNVKKEPYVLVGTVVDYEGDSIVFSLPVDGRFFSGAKQIKVPVAEDGSFKCIIDSETAGFASTFHPKLRQFVRLWIEPGLKDSVVLNFNEEKLPEFFGNQTDGNKLLSSFERAPYFHAFGGFDSKFQKDSSAISVYDTLEFIKRNELQAIKKLEDENSISVDFAEAMRLDSDYHWKSVFASVAWHHYYFKYELKRDSFYDEEWDKLYNELFESFDPAADASVTMYFRTLAEDYISLYLPVVKGMEVRDSTLSQNEGVNRHHSFRLDLIRERFEGKNKELLWAYYLFQNGLQKQFEKSLLTSYDEFVEEFPESPFDEQVSKYIEPIRDYHTRIEAPMPDDIILIENAHEYTTWEEVVGPYKGEILYVDLWATWCGPCKQEFEHKDGLYEYIKDKSIKILYVSSDRDEAEQKWKEMVNFYGLKGINMRISQDLNWKIWGMIHNEKWSSIPRYLIVDKEGNMIVKEAARPSEGQKLYDQLAKYLEP